MRERYLTAKELSAALEEMGIRRSPRWIREVWKAKGAPHLQYRECQLGIFLEWLQENPRVRVNEQDRKRIPMSVI